VFLIEEWLKNRFEEEFILYKFEEASLKNGDGDKDV
jgi:hypothetical protein